MHILNIRDGFACNSSSTHSLVRGAAWPTTAHSEFGWEQFTVSPADIGYYVAACYASHFVGQYGRPAMHNGDRAEIKRICGVAYDSQSSVDHQSMLPVGMTSSGRVNIAFVQDTMDWLRSRNIGVIGGNDNDDSTYGGPNVLGFPGPIEWVGIARKAGDWWRLFDPRTGDRKIFSFIDEPTAPYRALDLVDMKITGYCPFGCAYCYQSSTKAGKHATFEDVWRAIDQCADVGVFEIAFGGGEPTLHPRFADIVGHAYARGIVPNVTTRNVQFLRDMLAGQYTDIGGVAFSVDTADGARRAAGFKALNKATHRLSVQIVDETVSAYAGKQIRDICADANIPITWLGFKNVGLGTKARKDKSWFVADVLSAETGSVRVDTAMLAGYGDELRAWAGDDNYRITAWEYEGANSCYVDCVAQTIASSSYHLDTTRPLVNVAAQWRNLDRVSGASGTTTASQRGNARYR